jgi:hypothetical protein
MPTQSRLGVVAAGALAPAGLAAAGVPRIPLLRREGRTLLDHACTSLLEGAQASRVLVLAPVEVELPARAGVERAAYSGKVIADLFALLRASTEEVLVLSSGDLPLLTPAAVAAICAVGEERQADLVYPVADLAEIKARFPQAHKTSWRIGGKLITGGNVFWIRRRWLLELEPLIERLFARRKDPLAIAKLFGPWFLLRALLGLADLPYLERRLGQIAAGRLCAALLPYPELVLDLDKPIDLATFSPWLDPLPSTPE